MSRIVYQRTQPGTAIVVFLLIVVGIEGTVSTLTGSPVTYVAAGVCVLIGIVFSQMTIAVSAEAVEWWFAFGLLRRRVALTRVEDATVKRVSLLSGLGIRTDGRNWLWIVSGREAVVCRLRDGRRIALGSPEPDRVASIINGLLVQR